MDGDSGWTETLDGQRLWVDGDSVFDMIANFEKKLSGFDEQSFV